MSASVQKVLVHGKDIIANFGLLPIGILSEVAESRNKDLRQYREHHSRNFRKSTNKDILNYFLISSDAYISTISPKLVRKHKLISRAAKTWLVEENKDTNKENFGENLSN